MNNQWIMHKSGALFGTPLGNTKEQVLQSIEDALKEHPVDTKGICLCIHRLRHTLAFAEAFNLSIPSGTHQEVVVLPTRLQNIKVKLDWSDTDVLGRPTKQVTLNFNYNKDLLEKIFEKLLAVRPIKKRFHVILCFRRGEFEL